MQGVGGETTYETRFYVPLGGSVWIRSWQWSIAQTSTKDLSGTQVTIFTDVFNTLDDDPQQVDHDWMLYITDILDLRGKPNC